MTNSAFVSAGAKPKGKGRPQPTSIAGMAQSWNKLKSRIMLVSVIFVGVCVIVSPFCSPLFSHIDPHHLPWFLTLKVNLTPGLPSDG